MPISCSATVHSNIDGIPNACDYPMNSMGLCPNKDAHIVDSHFDKIEKPVIIGPEQKRKLAIKNALTWKNEGTTNVRRAIHYYRQSAQWFSVTDNSPNPMIEIADQLELLIKGME